MEDRPSKKIKLDGAEEASAMISEDAPKATSATPCLWRRIEQMDFTAAPQEAEVGITEYVKPDSPAIHGILKVCQGM